MAETIEDAKITEYDHYTINLLPGDYNATASIGWNNSATKEIIINGNNIIGSYTITENTTTADVNINNTNIPKSPSNITVKYTGSSVYNDATTTTTITTNKAQTIITINPVTTTANKTATLTARVTTQDDTPINEGKVVFKINGKTVKDANGKVIYAKVSNGIASVEYNVPTNLIDQNITLTATITDNGKIINKGKVVFKINGKTVKNANGKVIYANVTNNIASIEYTIPANMKANTYNITATFTSTDYDKLEDIKTLTLTE